MRNASRPKYWRRGNGRRSFERERVLIEFCAPVLLDLAAQRPEYCFMKRLSKQARGGFTRRDLVVVILVLVLLATMIVPAVQKARQKSWRIRCLNNLKEIGGAERFLAGDLLPKSNAGPYCWKYYASMTNGPGLDPKLLVCPADERRPATDLKTDFKGNTHVSYFVGVNAADVNPWAIAGGDRNLGPGTVPDPNCGYSPTNGNGNDVIISGPVCWSLKMHSHGNPAGSGNILLGDGSGQQISSASLTQTLTNFPGTNGIRLVFP
jgi:hypothetical protein